MDITLTCALIASCALSLAIGYAFWTRIRLLRLKVDLLEILADFRDAAKRLDAKREPAYCQVDESLRGIEKHADIVSLDAFLYIRKGMASRKAEPERFRSDNPAFQNLIDRTNDRIASRLSNYVLRETISGRFYVYRAVREHTKKAVRRDMKQQAMRSVVSLGVFSSHASHC